jgi:hypothetical protein
MSQCTSGNFPGIFRIFRIFFVAYMNYLASSILFFSSIMNSKNKRNSFSFYLFLSSFSAHICFWPINPKSAGAPKTPCVVRFFSSAQLSPRPTTPTRQHSHEPACESPSGPTPRLWPVSMADTARTPPPPVPLACTPG